MKTKIVSLIVATAVLLWYSTPTMAETAKKETKKTTQQSMSKDTTKKDLEAGHSEGDGHDHSKHSEGDGHDHGEHHEGDGHDHSKEELKAMADSGSAKDDHSKHDHPKTETKKKK